MSACWVGFRKQTVVKCNLRIFVFCIKVVFDMPKNAKNPTPRPSGNSEKWRFENWLNIGNLILTAVIGIVIAVYINIRNEKLQKQLVTLQNESQFANIEFSGSGLLGMNGVALS